MAGWLKLIGSRNAPITEAPFHGAYTKEHVGFRKANKPGIRAGDHLFLYAPGGSRRIFALAEAISDPERDPNYDPDQEGSCQWTVPVHYLINLPVASGILIDDIISSQRGLTQSLRQASHIKLLPEESDTAQRMLEAARGQTPPIAGLWLYPISSGADRAFTLADGRSIPVTVDSYRTLVENGRLVEDLYWRISQNWNSIQIGDEVFIYTGDQDLGIIGYATVGAVEQRADGWYILPHFDLARSRALLENPVTAAVVREWVPFPRKNVINLASFRESLRAHLPWTGRDAVTHSVLPEEITEPSSLVEGAVRSITVNAYERNPQARRECIHAHGTTCCICGFDFGTVYGKVADGYIHVHHLRPLSEVNSEYVVDPVKDLRPVCPNCHAVLHLGGESRSIEEVKKMVEDHRA
jgi:hypothetical protein